MAGAFSQAGVRLAGPVRPDRARAAEAEMADRERRKSASCWLRCARFSGEHMLGAMRPRAIVVESDGLLPPLAGGEDSVGASWQTTPGGQGFRGSAYLRSPLPARPPPALPPAPRPLTGPFPCQRCAPEPRELSPGGAQPVPPSVPQDSRDP